MYLSDQRYEEIKTTITELFEDYNISNLPIDVDELIEKMNIKVVKYSDCSLKKQNELLNASNDGLSYYNSRKNCFIICVNDKNHNKQRLRFTLMHEIGHIVLGHEESNELTESEADYFARNALAPMAIVVKKMMASPDEIMKTFDISFQCSGIVLKMLGIKIQYNHMELKEYDLHLLKLFNM